MRRHVGARRGFFRARPAQAQKQKRVSLLLNMLGIFDSQKYKNVASHNYTTAMEDRKSKRANVNSKKRITEGDKKCAGKGQEK